MIAVELMPGFVRWGRALGPLLERPEPIWVYGPLGSGVSTLARILADRRGSTCLDDVERLDPVALEAWRIAHPMGIMASHLSPESEALAAVASHCLPLRLEGLEEDLASVDFCLQILAAEEGLAGLLPASLGALPCPGNLRGLRNRLVRWKLLGQLPDPMEAQPPLVLADAEDLATNLHHLERLLLHRALRRSLGNRVEAARRLGVSHRQIYLLIRRHGDPMRGEIPTDPGPKRWLKRQVKTS